MKKVMTTVWVALVVIGLVSLLAGLIVPMVTAPAETGEPVALIGLNESQAQELYETLYGIDNHGLWNAIAVAGGIVLVIGAVPLTVMIISNRSQKAKSKKKKKR